MNVRISRTPAEKFRDEVENPGGGPVRLAVVREGGEELVVLTLKNGSLAISQPFTLDEVRTFAELILRFADIAEGKE